MSATYQWYQTNGASPGNDTPQSQTTSINNWDFKSVDTPGPAVAGEEITAGSFSFHVYNKVRFTGSFSAITNVKFYASTTNVSGYGVGAYILCSGVPSASYLAPLATDKSGLWPLISGSSTGATDISTTALGAGTAGFTDYAALQLKTTTSGAEAGIGGYTAFTVVWDEV